MGVVPPQPGFNAGLAELCRGHGALFISDEVMTGFRASRRASGGSTAPRGLGARPVHVRQGHRRRLPGRGVRRPRRRHGACSRPRAGVPGGHAVREPVATTAGLATLRLATDDVYARLDRRRRHDQARLPRPRSPTAGVPHTRAVRRQPVLRLLHRRHRSATSTTPSARTPRRYAAFFHAHARRAASTCRRRRSRPGSSPPRTTTRRSRPSLDALPAAARAAARAAATVREGTHG